MLIAQLHKGVGQRVYISVCIIDVHDCMYVYMYIIYLCFELNEVDWFIHPLQMVTLQCACVREMGRDQSD